MGKGSASFGCLRACFHGFLAWIPLSSFICDFHLEPAVRIQGLRGLTSFKVRGELHQGLGSPGLVADQGVERLARPSMLLPCLHCGVHTEEVPWVKIKESVGGRPVTHCNTWGSHELRKKSWEMLFPPPAWDVKWNCFDFVVSKCIYRPNENQPGC